MKDLYSVSPERNATRGSTAPHEGHQETHGKSVMLGSRGARTGRVTPLPVPRKLFV